ncbi:hypothetical protein BRARA_D01404 [Brassica rapa]|uniref:AB hydrolase-1 domain-containing protein n=1 Tax=Brassica campestris TaxID=3711 RepID=A0A397ZTH7_BRACM|nr:hypothetical protein BRARA_D01404 [Brassica rapa]
MEKNQKRFVLVHGLCHGMWTCYKEEIETLKDYCKPLLEFLSSLCSDKVILVAHSMGGISAALASDIFPHTIAAFVYLTAFMPDTRNPLAYYVLQKRTFSEKGYGSVTFIYIICGEDLAVPEDYQRWMISR